VLSSVRIRAQIDLMDEDGTIIDIRTAQAAPARVDHMQRFEWTTCSRLAEAPSGVVRSDILVTGNTPQLITEKWEVSAADVQWTDALYPLAQEAMRRGYYASHTKINKDIGFRPVAVVLLAKSFPEPNNRGLRAVLFNVLGRVGTEAVYTYDFGDSWEHGIVVEKRLSPEPGRGYPACLAGERHGPPEDCGISDSGH
jgi:hypothetical protein